MIAYAEDGNVCQFPAKKTPTCIDPAMYFDAEISGNIFMSW